MSFDARVEVTPEVTQEETPQTLTVSQIVMDLGNGIDRAGIRKKYGLTAAELKMVFSHPKLKKLRVKKHQVIRVQLIDDTVDVNQTSIPVEAENVTAVVDVQSFPSSEQWDNQTRVEEGLDYKGDNNSYNTEIQD
tara:strand:- start:862 stop:1266 length:405 start_codon:yes stop_codon:yes gene_type:complete